jgi:peptide/nickel transport system substrate-binding protein
MKRQMRSTWISLILIIAMLFMVSCSQTPQGSAPAPEVSEETPAETATPSEQPEEDASKTGGIDRRGGDVIVVNNYVSTTLDPRLSNLLMANYQWMQNVYETPLAIDSSGRFYPQVCDFEYSDDGITLSLTVREESVFSNGEKVTIEDVIATLETVAANNDGFKTNFYENIADQKVEGNTVTLTFHRLDPSTLDYLADLRGPCYIMPKAVIDKFGEGEFISDVSDVIGSGPYVLKEYTPDVRVIVERNENYVPVLRDDVEGPAGTRHAHPDTITYAVNVDAASRTAGLIAGDYTVGAVIPDMAPHAEEIGLTRFQLDNLWLPSIFFNLSDENADSIVQNKDFRKAVRAALDMDAIMLSATHGEDGKYTLDPTPISPMNTDYHNNIIRDTEWNIADPVLAKKYLEASGYDGEEIVWMVSQSATFYDAAVPAVQMLQDVGINVKLEVVDSGSHSSLRIDPTTGHDIGAWETQGAVINPITQRNLVLGVNGGWWENEEKDNLLEIMRTTKTGSAESIQAYKDFCELITEEVPWIIWGLMRTTTFVQPGFNLNYQGTSAYYWNSYFTE